MFIPKRAPESYIGTTQILNKDIDVTRGTFKKGSIVLIIEVTSRGYDFKDLESGEYAREVGFDIFDITAN